LESSLRAACPHCRLHLLDVGLDLADALRQPVELALDELEALLRGLDARVDVGLDEVVGEPLATSRATIGS
jgi:hypothetical protein